MKRILALIIVLPAISIQLNAQLSERIVIKAGDNVATAFSPTGFYRFEQFTEGVCTLKNGIKSKARFNYHILNGEIEYINVKNDTLAIGIPEEIVDVTIGEKNSFVYSNNSYLEIMASTPAYKLAKRIRVTLENDRKGGYGESAPASSQVNLKNVSMTNGLYHLSYDIAILKTTVYYWLDGKNNLQPANKKNSMKLVSKGKQPKLEAWLDENKINFNNEEDLVRLLQFTGTL